MSLSRTCSLALVALSLCAVACGPVAPETKTDPAPTAARKAAEPRPAWLDGDFPQEPFFFGRAAAPVQGGDRAAAAEAARSEASANIKLELAILNKLVKDDHEEQVAEIVTRYPSEQFNVFADKTADGVLASAKVHAEYLDSAQNPPVLHVLFALSPDAYFDGLLTTELPDQQKGRIRDYRITFSRNVLTNLGRQ